MSSTTRAPVRRRGGWRAAAAVVAGVLVIAFLASSAALNSVRFVGGDADGRVAIYRGVPYRLPAGIELWRLEYRSGIPIASLHAAQRAQVLEHDLQTPDEAAGVVRAIELSGSGG